MQQNKLELAYEHFSKASKYGLTEELDKTISELQFSLNINNSFVRYHKGVHFQFFVFKI